MRVFFDTAGPATTTPGHETAVQISGGRTAILWEQDAANQSGQDFLLLQLDAASDTPSDPIVLATDNLLYTFPRLLELPDGRFAVSFRAYDREAGVEDDRIVLQLRDSDGGLLSEQQFPRPEGFVGEPALVAEEDGYALLWYENQYDPQVEEFVAIQFRIQQVAADGTLQGGAVDLMRIPGDLQWVEYVVLDNGNIAVGWAETRTGVVVPPYDNITTQTGYARIFQPDGTPVSEVIALGAADVAGSLRVQIVAQPEGGFAALWDEGFDFGRAERAIAGQAFDATGVATGEIQRIEYRSGLSDAVSLPDGRVVALIDDRQRRADFQTEFNITMQEFSPTMVPLGDAELVLSGVRNPFDLSVSVDADHQIAVSYVDRVTLEPRLQIFDATAFRRLDEGDNTVQMQTDDAGVGAGAGDDSVTGTDTADAVQGEAGDDTLTTGAGDDRLAGGAGADVLDGGTGDDQLWGGRDADRVIAGAGADTLEGGGGGDILNGGAGADLIYGGSSLPESFSTPVRDFDLGDRIFGLEGADTIYAGAGNDFVWGGDDDDLIFGEAGADTLVGQDGDDTMDAGLLGDVLFGGAGADVLDGGQGFDRLNGGSGADEFYHLSRLTGGSDWIQDFSTSEGDFLSTDRQGAQRDWYQVNIADTAGAGDADTAEAFIIFRPTGQIVWALVDGAGEDSINLQIGDQVFDLLA